MATIKDVAKRAGVSHGTVSNVLNGRGNVSAKKVAAVMNAAQQMGYELNTQAQLLRSKSQKFLALVLPNVTSEVFSDFFDGIRQQIEITQEREIDLFITNDLSINEKAIIKKIAGGNYQKVVTISCLDNANEYYQQLKISDKDIFFIYRRPKNAILFFNLDYNQAAIDIINDINFKDYSIIYILTDTLRYQYVADFIDACNTKIVKGKKIVTFFSETGEDYSVAFDLFATTCPDAIIVTDFNKLEYVRLAHELRCLDTLPPIYVLGRSAFSSFKKIIFYQMSYHQLGKDIVHFLNDKKNFSTFITKNDGFSNTLESHKKNRCKLFSKSASLNVLLLPSPSSNALAKILPNFQKLTGIKVNLVTLSYDEYYNVISNLCENSCYDLLRLDIAVLPWFAQDILMPLYDFLHYPNDILQKFSSEVVNSYTKVNNIHYSIPFDASSQVLFFRKDLFSNVMLSRIFLERFSRPLSVPFSLKEFDDINGFFSSLHQFGNPQRPMGTSFTTGNSALIATEFLARYYALGGRIFHLKESPHLNKEIATQALIGYIKQSKKSIVINENWWSAAVKFFEGGKMAMQIGYMNLFNDVAHSPLLPVVGCTSVPGGVPQLGGGAIGMSKFSKKKSECQLFLNWLYSDAITEYRVLLGGSSAQKHLYKNYKVLRQYPWFDSLDYNLKKGIRESSLTQTEVFDLHTAEKIIGVGVRNALNNLVGIEKTVSLINIELMSDKLVKRIN